MSSETDRTFGLASLEDPLELVLFLFAVSLPTLFYWTGGFEQAIIGSLGVIIGLLFLLVLWGVKSL